MVVDNLYLMYTPFPYNCYCNIILFLINEEYLILIKCYTGETAGDQIVTVFELDLSCTCQSK